MEVPTEVVGFHGTSKEAVLHLLAREIQPSDLLNPHWQAEPRRVLPQVELEAPVEVHTGDDHGRVGTDSTASPRNSRSRSTPTSVTSKIGSPSSKIARTDRIV